MRKNEGYSLIILMMVIAVMSIGLMLAVPVWQTQIQREKEEELIFRGKQYVEAIRLYQMKHPGTFPKAFEDLFKERCLRQLYKDPMTEDGEWNVILHAEGVSRQKGGSPQKIMIAPQKVLTSIKNPLIIGVVSASTKKSIRIYYDNDIYDKWLFYYGQDPAKMPEIIFFGQSEKD